MLALVFASAIASTGCTLVFGATGGVIGVKTAHGKDESHRMRAGIAIGMLTGLMTDLLIVYACLNREGACIGFRPEFEHGY